jgi:predicted Zn-dependent protease
VYLSAVHEAGHALGLAHSDRFGDVMYQFRSQADPERFFAGYRRRLRGVGDIGSAGASGLTPRDVAALRALYALPGR